MRYVGSKKRVAKKIEEIVLELRQGRDVYWEPFCGGLNSFSRIAPNFPTSKASDSHEDLVLMWQELHQGWVPPALITEAEYQGFRNAEPSALRGLAGFGGSFGGKWFGGYARGGRNSDGSPRNHQAESARAAMARIKELGSSNVRFACQSYLSGEVSANMVIYCDPPYAATLGYKGTDAFDHEAFWDWCRASAALGALVLVSEYTAPGDVECIAEFDHRMSVALTTDRRTTTERLFLVDGGGDAK